MPLAIFPENFPPFSEGVEKEGLLFNLVPESSEQLPRLSNWLLQQIWKFVFAFNSRPEPMSLLHEEVACLRKWTGPATTALCISAVLKNRADLELNARRNFQDSLTGLLEFRLQSAIFSLAIGAAQAEILKRPSNATPGPSAEKFIVLASEAFSAMRGLFKAAKKACDIRTGLSDFIFSIVFPAALPHLPPAWLPRLVGFSDPDFHFEEIDGIWKNVFETHKWLQGVLPVHVHAAAEAGKRRRRFSKFTEEEKQETERTSIARPRYSSVVHPSSASLSSRLSRDTGADSAGDPSIGGPWRWAGKFVQPRKISITSRLSEEQRMVSQSDFASLVKEWENEGEVWAEGAGGASQAIAVAYQPRRSSLSTESFYEGNKDRHNVTMEAVGQGAQSGDSALPFFNAGSPKKRRRSDTKSPTIIAASPVIKRRVLVAATPETSMKKPGNLFSCGLTPLKETEQERPAMLSFSPDENQKPGNFKKLNFIASPEEPVGPRRSDRSRRLSVTSDN